jgi:hypothetical protein
LLDLDGSEAYATVRFGLDGAEYEIDPGGFRVLAAGMTSLPLPAWQG